MNKIDMNDPRFVAIVVPALNTFMREQADRTGNGVMVIEMVVASTLIMHLRDTLGRQLVEDMVMTSLAGIQ